MVYQDLVVLYCAVCVSPRAQADSDSKMLMQELERECQELEAALRREKLEREKGEALTRERMENEKKELQLSVDRDRDCFARKMAEEHDQRRLEHMEMQVSYEKEKKRDRPVLPTLSQRHYASSCCHCRCRSIKGSASVLSSLLLSLMTYSRVPDLHSRSVWRTTSDPVAPRWRSSSSDSGGRRRRGEREKEEVFLVCHRK